MSWYMVNFWRIYFQLKSENISVESGLELKSYHIGHISGKMYISRQHNQVY